jgi:hypothetical protein
MAQTRPSSSSSLLSLGASDDWGPWSCFCRPEYHIVNPSLVNPSWVSRLAGRGVGRRDRVADGSKLCSAHGREHPYHRSLSSSGVGESCDLLAPGNGFPGPVLRDGNRMDGPLLLSFPLGWPSIEWVFWGGGRRAILVLVVKGWLAPSSCNEAIGVLRGKVKRQRVFGFSQEAAAWLIARLLLRITFLPQNEWLAITFLPQNERGVR